MTILYGIYGAGGCGRGVMPILAKQMKGQAIELVFVDDLQAGETVNGYPVRSWESFVAHPASRKAVALAVADSRIRENLDLKRASRQINVVDIFADNCIIMDDVVIGAGSIISPFVTITSNIRIGSHFHCNIGSYVEHDCRIGNYVTFAPGVHCNGNVHIQDHVYIGSGAVIKQGTAEMPRRIGQGAVVGMGAIVTRDVEPGTTVIGNPARVIRGS